MITSLLAIADKLISQNRCSDALPLLESALSAPSTVLFPPKQEQNHNHSADDDAAGSTTNSNKDHHQHQHSSLFFTIVIKYATCLVNLQRFEAALYVIESSYQQQQNHYNNENESGKENKTNHDGNTRAFFAPPPPPPPEATAGGMFNSNSNFVTSAVVAGVIEPSPPRSLTDEGPEGLTRKLPTDALNVALECALALHDWSRTKLYANALLYIDASSCSALLALGKLACSNASPNDATSFLVRALKADPFCSTALDMIVDNWLLPTIETEQLVLSLEFGSASAAAGEVVRNMYLARIPDAGVQLTSSEGVPLWLRNYHEAVVLLEANDLDGAIRCSSNALSGTPIKQYVACLHLSVLTQTHETATLFRFAHLLSEAFPSSAVAFYAAGCYYFSIGSFERAGRLFSRSTDLDPLFAEAWIAYGHCYARLEEGEQALAAYRRAQNLFPGLHQCDLFLGIQYARQHSAQLALACLNNAQHGSNTSNQIRRQHLQQQQQQQQQQNHSMNNIPPLAPPNNNDNHHSAIDHALVDPSANTILPPLISSSSSSYEALLLNETAVLYFRSKQYAAALQLLMRARDALPNRERPADHEVCILFNLASAFRKVNHLDLAAGTYLDFIRLRPQAAIGHCAYGFTQHLLGDLDGAIASYRTALALRRDAFCRDLLERALEERHGSGYFNSFPGGIDGWLGNNNNNNSNGNGNGNDDDAAASGNNQNQRATNHFGNTYFDPSSSSTGMNNNNNNNNNNNSNHGGNLAAQLFQQMSNSNNNNQQQQPLHQPSVSQQRGQYHPSPAPYYHQHQSNNTTSQQQGAATAHSHFSAGLNFVFDQSLLPAAVVGGGHNTYRSGSTASNSSSNNNGATTTGFFVMNTDLMVSGQQQHPHQQAVVTGSEGGGAGRGSVSIQRQSHHVSPRPTISRALSFQ